MRAVDFPNRNLMLAEDQPEYETLPVFVEIKEMKVLENQQTVQKHLPWSMIACFELSDREVEEIIKTKSSGTGKVYSAIIFNRCNYRQKILSYDRIQN